MPKAHYNYTRLSAPELIDIAQDKLLLLYDLWFADFERLPIEARTPQLERLRAESLAMRMKVASFARSTDIPPEPAPRWVRRRLGAGRLPRRFSAVGRARPKV